MNEIMTFRRAAASSGIPSSVLPDAGDAARLMALDDYEILDSAPEKSYDDIARLAAFICDTPIALISFFDRDRQWIKAGFTNGVLSEKFNEAARSYPFCDLSIQYAGQVVTVANMVEDERFADHRWVSGENRLRFYSAVPLVAPAGEVLGTLSVLDNRPRTLALEQASALETLARQVMELLEMRRTVIGLSVANAKLGQQSLTDALTMVPNRRAYDQKLIEEAARAKRTGAALCMLMIDIDLFKQYNDTFGHPAGDTALQSLARVLQGSLRSYDFLARYGGEEFVIILPATELGDAFLVAERIRARVAGSDFPHRKFTVSIGAARLDASRGIKALMQAADNNLYEAKALGRNKVVMHEAAEALV